MLTVRSMARIRWKLFLICSVCICSFFLIDQMASNSFRFIYHKIELSRMLKYGKENTLQIKFNYIEETDGFINSVNQLMQYIDKVDGIYAGGSYDESSEYFGELKNNPKYQNINRKAYANTFRMETLGLSEVIYVNHGMEQLCKLKTIVGDTDFKKYKEENIRPVLVGYGLRDILKAGTIITSQSNGQKYQVVGILEKDQKWFGDVDAVGTGVVSLNYKIIAARSQNEIDKSDNRVMSTLCTLSTSFLLLESNSETENIKNLIITKAKQLGLSVSIVPMEEVIKDYEESYRENMNTAFLITFVFVLFSSIAISSSAVVSILMRKREIGILYANGCSRRDIAWKIILENAYIIFLSVGIAFSIRTYLILKDKFKAFSGLIRQIHIQLTLPFMVLITLLIIIIASVPPVMIMSKMKPVELIGGNE